MFVLVLSAALSAQTAVDDPALTGRWAASTPQLAAELLPPELAADAVSHAFGRDPHLIARPIDFVRFEGRASQTSDGFCSRKSYYVSIRQKPGSAELEPQKPVVGYKVRLGNCDGIFAYLNPGATGEDGRRVLRWLEWAIQTAQSGTPLPFAVSCSDEMPYDKDRCASGARAALAALPLGKVTIMTKDFDRAHRWNVAVADTQLGDTYWEMKVDGTPANPSIDLTWKIPAPF